MGLGLLLFALTAATLNLVIQTSKNIPANTYYTDEEN